MGAYQGGGSYKFFLNDAATKSSLRQITTKDVRNSGCNGFRISCLQSLGVASTECKMCVFSSLQRRYEVQKLRLKEVVRHR